MNVLNIDLNLLLAFDAIYRERHVSRAATTLALSQPAMSNSLRRLRVALDDPLFVKSKGGVTPTPFADKLAPSISNALQQISDGLKNAAAFDPERETRTFSIAMSDVAEVSILADIIDVCKKTAPGIRFRTALLTKNTLTDDLESGAVDLAIGFLPDAKDSMFQQTLFNTSYVCIVRSGHPQINSELSKTQFTSAEFAVATTDITGHAAIVRTLESLSLGQQIAIRAPHFLALPFIVATTDCIAVVPKPLAQKVRPIKPVRIFKPPIRFPEIDVRAYWHERVNKDPANQWLRATIRNAFAQAQWD